MGQVRSDQTGGGDGIPWWVFLNGITSASYRFWESLYYTGNPLHVENGATQEPSRWVETRHRPTAARGASRVDSNGDHLIGFVLDIPWYTNTSSYKSLFHAAPAAAPPEQQRRLYRPGTG